ncbi:MAG: transcription termination/antitermination protein NusA [Victivallales bacterium]|nr:transcription termination/antitermination protein NusA [Victivallales bacterium]
MANELLTILEYIEQERGISRDVLTQAVEKALLSASRKSIHPAKNLTVKLDRNSGEIKAWAQLEVVDSFPTSDQILIERVHEKMPDAKLGDVVEWEVTPSNFGRIAAQTCKQAIMQQLKIAEKEIVKDEYADKIGTIVNGIVRRYENGNIIVDLGKAEGVISSRNKIPGEHYVAGDRINALLTRVDITGSGPSLILSRAGNEFLAKLFEREVTEIHDGVVQIMAVAREAGSRSKIAVKSNDPRVDPIGACVGMRGMRVKSITNELGGERLDIVRYDEDVKVFAANALQPAKPSRIEANEAGRSLDVYVTKDQSRLAFGKKAQNVRLSSKLLGWSFNIHSEDEEKQEESFEEKIDRAVSSLSAVLGVDESVARLLVNSGFLSPEGLKELSEEELAAIDGLEDEDVQQILAALND